MFKHESIAIGERVELLNIAPMASNPLISHCEIKVCYIGENRNHSVINEETAIKLANSLHGCPIAGYYSEKDNDFSGHNRSIEIGDGKFNIIDKTKAYGFVDSSAKIWFQEFSDDGVAHKYLMTEGWIWTSLYEEANRIIEHGNNQSMELDEEKLQGHWTFDDNGLPKFFIINEAMIQKLCILGEDVEPCFEGAGIAAQFSYSENFKNQIYSLIDDIKTALSKGGFNPMDEQEKKDPTLDSEFAKKNEEEDKEDKKDNDSFPPAKDDDKEDKESASEDDEKEEEDDDKKKKPAARHELTDEEVTESELYQNLQNQFAALQQQISELEKEIVPLRQFKQETEKKAKQALIDSFYMLSDAEKKDCIDNIDNYSLDDIEAKLSIICVRNKVSFNLDNDKEKEEENSDKKDPLIYQLGDNDDGDTAPAWIKAVRETAKELN